MRVSAPTESMVLADAQALHEAWRAAYLPGGPGADYRSLIKPRSLFPWANLHPENQAGYLRQSRTVLTAVYRFVADEGK